MGGVTSTKNVTYYLNGPLQTSSKSTLQCSAVFTGKINILSLIIGDSLHVILCNN
jgi:hypothetical protein